MTKLNVYVVRHGQTYYNIYNKLQGWSNSPLTDKGIQDAQAAGQKLAETTFAAAYCSDTTRAEQTAKMILAANHAGAPEAWYMAGAPHGLATFKQIVEKYSIGKAKDFLKAADPFHDAEDNAEYWQRLYQGFALIRSNDQLKDGDNVLLISHGNTVLSMMEKFGQGKYDLTVRPQNGSVTKLIVTADDVTVDYYNRK